MGLKPVAGLNYKIGRIKQSKCIHKLVKIINNHAILGINV